MPAKGFPMVPNANARHFLLKAKQRDLIAAAGGNERAAAVCSYSRSVVGRWNSPDSPEIMELPAIFALEEETGRHDMSEAIASSRGRRFAETEIEAGGNGSVMSSHAAAVVQMGELMTAGAIAFADGRLTPSEAVQIDRALTALQRCIDDYRKVMADVRGSGARTLVGGEA